MVFVFPNHNMSDKKISDIIAELELKIDNLLGYVKNIDFTNKLILSKLSKLEENKSSVILSNSTEKYVHKVDPAINLIDAQGLPDLNKPVYFKDGAELIFKNADDELVSFKDADEPAPEPLPLPPLPIDVEPQSKKTRKSGKVTVEQSISYPDGTKAVLVNVEIYTASNVLVKKTRTTSIGKWSALLDPGKYFVRLTKAPVNGKPSINKQFEVDVVSNEKNILELNSL